MKLSLQVTLFLLFTNFLVAKCQTVDSVVIGFYNLENLFDTLNDYQKEDDDFLPYGIHAWGSERYQKKILNLSRVINAMNSWQAPDVIGLCEVENRTVLVDLLQTKGLVEKGYAILHKDSPDNRGIDVCALYKPSVLHLLNYVFIEVQISETERPTRDVLYAQFLRLKSNDTLHLFFNHWPSRYGGEEVSAHKRVFVAELLKHQVDSIVALSPQANIIVAGDFNDTPSNESIQLLLADSTLNFAQTENALPGTHKFQAEWNTFDQFFISKSITNYTSFVFTPQWLLLNDEKYTGSKPFRTFNGPNYLGGYSDHFGIVLKWFLPK